MSSIDLRRIAGALAGFWSGGAGPTRAQIRSALLVAGYGGPDEGNKQEFVQSAVTVSENGMARSVVEELLALLREHGYFESGSVDEKVARLSRAIDQGSHSLDEDGFITWSSSSPGADLQASVESVSPASLGLVDSDHAGQEESGGGYVEAAIPSLDLLISSLRRLGMGAVRPITDRRRRDRDGIVVGDEYDIQDLVEVVLRSLYNDVRSEEPTPSSGGSSSRMDLHLREGSTAIEIKVTAPGRSERHIKPEVLVDINDYRGHPTVTTLIVAVFDMAATFTNPAGFEHDLSGNHDDLDVRVIVVPWVGPLSSI